MASAESRLASYTAMCFLMLAIVAIRTMRWLYNRGLIREKTTDLLFHYAKLLEKQADRLTTGKLQRD
jgi:hypothetical protein